MTIPSEINKSGPYFGNGVTTVFNYGFRIVDASHLTVLSTVNEVDTTVSPSAYDVSGVGDATGIITFLVAPASGTEINILRNVPFTQDIDLENQGAYYAETVERGFDLSVMRDQQLQEEMNRAIKVPVGSAPLGFDEVVEGLLRFGSVYQGHAAADLTVRADGSALQAGDLYFNTVTGEYRQWTGAVWAVFSKAASIVNYRYLATSGQTVFTGADLGGKTPSTLTSGSLLVFLNGVALSEPVDFTVTGSGASVTLAVGADVNDDLLITEFRQIAMSQLPASVSSDADRAEDAADRAEAAASALEEAADQIRQEFSTVSGQTDYLMSSDLALGRLQVFRGGQLLASGDYSVFSSSGSVYLRLGWTPLHPVDDAELITCISLSAVGYDPNENRMENLRTRAVLVTHIGLFGAIAGQVYSDGVRLYRTIPASHPAFGLNPIPDLPGLMPFDDCTVEHWAPQANHAEWIMVAADGVDILGGGDLWCRGQYQVQHTGTWNDSNGDLNCCVRIVTTNPVRLRGLQWISRIVQTDTRIAHTVAFGIRIQSGAVISAPGGIDGIIVEGNRATAISEGVSFEGGIGIYVAAVDAAGTSPWTDPGERSPEAVSNVILSNFTVRNTWAYGVGFQRAAWNDCLITNFVIEDTGNDGIDCKADWPLLGNGNNWVRNGIIRRPALRQSSLIGQKAGCDLRLSWNVDNVQVEATQPIVAFRFQVQDPSVNSDSPNLAPFRQQMGNLSVTFSGSTSGSALSEVTAGSFVVSTVYTISSVGTTDFTLIGAASNTVGVSFTATGAGSGTGKATTSVTVYQFGYQFGTDYVQSVNLNSSGGYQGFRVRSNRGSYTNLVSRGASNQDLVILGQSGSLADANKFFGGEFGTVSVDGVSVNVDGTEFHGVNCATMTLSSDAVNTGIFGGEQGTLTDSGTGTLRLSSHHLGAFKAGRADLAGNGQYVLISGSGSGNFVTGVSPSGGLKPLVIEADANSTDVRINVASGSGRIVLEQQGVDVLTIGASGDVRILTLPTTEPATGSGRLWIDTAAGRVLKVKA